MDERSYLIPANSKRSQLILNIFNPLDAIIFAVGCTITLMLLFIIKSNNFISVVIILFPVSVTGTLCLPIPNYHNVRQLLINIYGFFTNRRRYVWKGWNMYEQSEK